MGLVGGIYHTYDLTKYTGTQVILLFQTILQSTKWPKCPINKNQLSRPTLSDATGQTGHV